MIERSDQPVLVPGADGVFVKSIVRATAPCGCTIFVGRREDNAEGASVYRVCSAQHEDLREDFHDRMRRSLEEEPSKRQYVEVADEILEGVMRDHA